MTDAPARQETPDDESGAASSENPSGAQREEQNQQAQGEKAQIQQAHSQSSQGGQNLPATQWSAEQPAPAPWFLGQAGPVPPNFPPPLPYPPVQAPPVEGMSGQYPPVPMPPVQMPPGQPQYPVPPLPPPTPDQANWPDHAPGTRPDQSAQQPPQDGRGLTGHGQAGQAQGGQAPNPNQPQQQPGDVPAAGPARRPGQSPGPALGPDGSPNQPAPWHDPNRYNQPDQRPQQHDPRSPHRPPQQPGQPQQPRGEEPGRRPPLSLRTRWARGLALGGAACTLITLLNGYRNFPDWLIGACAGLLMSLGGLWFGTFAQRDALRKAQRAPEAVASVVWSSISSLIALAVVSYSLVFFPQLRQYSDCMRAANTIAGQNTCQKQFENSLAAIP